MTMDEQKIRNEALEEAAKIVDGWLAIFGDRDPQFVTAQRWANDAVADIAEGIRRLKT